MAADVQPPCPATRVAARTGRVVDSGLRVATTVGRIRAAATAPARRVGGGDGRRATGDTAGPRTGPPPPRGPRRPVGRAGGDGGVLVAPGRLVGAAGAADGRRTMLRRLGGVGAAR